MKHVKACLVVATLAACATLAAELQPFFPLERTAFQTNEWIDIAMVRVSDTPLQAGELRLTLAGDDGSRAAFAFHVQGAALEETVPPRPPAAPGARRATTAESPALIQQARRTEHLRLSGYLLRPGRYRVQMTCDGATGEAAFDVYSHIRRSSFRLVHWGGNAKEQELVAHGEDGLGFNLVMGHFRGTTAAANVEAAIRGGLDFMEVCTLGGAHQMDGRLECDWSDPYVMRGGAARGARQAFTNRTAPNAAGVHFYDEPGLSYTRHPVTGDFGPHGVPAQERSYEAAFGMKPLSYETFDSADPAKLAAWSHWATWKLSFMPAAWKLAAFSVQHVRDDLLPVTQSVYGWSAFTDGYYYQVVRTLPLTSGHGGYDDLPLGYFMPGFFSEFARARDLARPYWYMPQWFGNTPAGYAMEQYLSFICGLTGMTSPPTVDTRRPSLSAVVPGMVQSNRVMGRLGTIFATMPMPRPEVAVLYSMSSNLHQDPRLGYWNHQFRQLAFVYLAAKSLHVPIQPVVDEDVLDGTLAARHRAVLIMGLAHLDPKVVAALEAFAAAGGTVVVSDDCRVRIAGATPLGLAVDYGWLTHYEELQRNPQAVAEFQEAAGVGRFMQAAEPTAKALSAVLSQAGIQPAFDCDQPMVIASKAVSGDIEYLFAVNATWDEKIGRRNSLKPVTARIGLPADRPIYDALAGGPVRELTPNDERLTGAFAFGPGQLRVFARTARPIGGVLTATPIVTTDYTLAATPQTLEIAAVLVDGDRRVLAGAAPMRITVRDPLGAVRYDLHRATDQGVLKIRLPLAVNDPAGTWSVAVRELLADHEEVATFDLRAPAWCGALAGAVPRALHFPGTGNQPQSDRDKIFRFFRLHKDVTLVAGEDEYCAAAAQRMTEILRPWGIRCRTVAAAEASRPRPVSEEESATWVGLTGAKGTPAWSGFDVAGPAILLGNAENNPLIEFAERQFFLPYRPVRDAFPGRGRGLLAWLLDAVQYGEEAVALIAYDAAGMAEAVGTLYEAAAGIDGLEPLTPPSLAAVAPASTGPDAPPPATVTRLAQFSGGIAAMVTLTAGRVAVLSNDGTLSVLDAAGREAWSRTLSGGDAWRLAAAPDGRVMAVGASHHVVAFDADGKLLCDVPMEFAALDGDRRRTFLVTAIAVGPDGSIAVSAADARLDAKTLLLAPDGQTLWTVNGVSQAEYADWQAQQKAWAAGAEQRKKDQEAVKAAQALYKTELDAWNRLPAKERGPKPEKPKPAVAPASRPVYPAPDIALAMAFVHGGTRLLAAAEKRAFLLAAADGATVGAPLDGVSGRGGLVPAGDDVLAGDGADGVVLLSPAQGKVQARLTLPKGSGVVGIAPAGPGAAVVAADGSRTVCLVDLNKMGQAEPFIWQKHMPGRIVRQLVPGNDAVAIVYWGGCVQVVNRAGDVLAERVLDSEVACLLWHETGLMVGLDSGQVLRLDVPR